MSDNQSYWARNGNTIIIIGLLVVAFLLIQYGQGGGEHPLLGKEAPAFKLAALDGSEQDLKDHLGKNVIVLDFFATWCPPCRQSLPRLDQLAKDYAGKNVVVYAIDVGEEPAEVKAYFKQEGLALVPLLDDIGTSDEYGVQGIPQQVVIGLDGRAQYVNAGFGPGVEDEIRSAVETLLAGKELTPAKSPGTT